MLGGWGFGMRVPGRYSSSAGFLHSESDRCIDREKNIKALKDENRVLATIDNIGSAPTAAGWSSLPYYVGNPATDMGRLAERDRLHASVAFYSSCNEDGCGPGTLLDGGTTVALFAACM